jgi:PAS domain S-box-containing protein
MKSVIFRMLRLFFRIKQSVLFGVSRDIIRTNEELASSKNFLTLIINTIPARVFWKDRNCRYLGCNDLFASDAGITNKEAIKGLTDYDLGWLSLAEKYRQQDSEVMESGIPKLTFVEPLIVDGKNRIIRTSKVPLRNSHGEIIGLLGTYEDITEHQLAENNLKESQIRFSQLADNIKDVFFLVEVSTRNIIYVNKAFIPLFGYDEDYVLPKCIDQLPFCTVEDAVRQRELIARVAENGGTGSSTEYKIMRRNSHEERCVRCTAWPVAVDVGKPIHLAMIVTDISEFLHIRERERLQHEQLIQADKMASLGILVSGVAHEINNPNNLIMLNTDILTNVWKDALPVLDQYTQTSPELFLNNLPYSLMREEIGALIHGISSGSERIRNIVHELKDFIRSDPGRMDQDVDVKKVVSGAVAIMSNLIKKSTHKFRVDCEDTLPILKGNFQQLEQVAINLISNACQALRSAKEGIIINAIEDKERKLIILTVTDEGEGISKERLSNIMNPFYTTRREKGGTGLGLSVSYSILKAHHGRLIFESSVGQGTRAIVELPFNVLPDTIERL